jgi:hypothetical protein
LALYGTLASLSQTAASNAADGSVDAPSTIDQQTNLLASFIAQLRDGSGFTGVGRGHLIGVQVFTASGTYTPTTGTTSVVVEAVGAGGGGGSSSTTGVGQTSAASGGGAGSFGVGRYTSGFSGAAVTIGAGGTGVGLSGANGNGGGTTVVGSLISCPGGTPGLGGAVVTPPSFCTGSFAAQSTAPTGANILAISGEPGDNGITLAGSQIQSGRGGCSVWGAGGNPVQNATSVGSSGGGRGSGGGGGANGASTAGQIGGNGSDGYVIIYEYA